MLPGYRSLLIGACALLLVSGCGSSSTGSSRGTISTPGGGTGGTGGGPPRNPDGGGGGAPGSNKLGGGTPPIAGGFPGRVGTQQDKTLPLPSADGPGITGFRNS